MAVTKIWDVTGRLNKPLSYIANPEKTVNPEYEKAHLQALEDVMSYAADEDKTEKRFYVSGINCNTTCARKQFKTVKESFGKEDGIVAYHGYQSFKSGDKLQDFLQNNIYTKACEVRIIISILKSLNCCLEWGHSIASGHS